MFYVVIVVWVLIDLFTKNLSFNYLQDRINILWDFLFLKYSENTWIAFSTQVPFLKILTILLIIWVFYYYFLERKSLNKKIPLNLPLLKGEIKQEFVDKNLKLLDLSFWLILAWAIWNWIERVFYWKVIDFIWVKYFAVFNLADSFITIWAVIYLYILFINRK